MTKQDVLDAINATIVENGTKAITAQSLNNVLTMITENTGEGGSGEGALRVIVPDMMQLGPESVAMGELSPASWEELKSLLEQMGVDSSEYDAVVKASFEHNANVAQQILEKAKAGQGVSVVLDQTPYCPASINVSLQMNPEMVASYEDFARCVVQPAALFAQYIKPTPEEGSMFGEDFFVCALAPTGNVYLDGMDATYPSNMLIILNLDGSLFFEKIEEEQPSSGSGVVTFYIPQILNNPTSEEISKNKASYDAYMNAIDKPIVRVCSNDGIAYMTAFSVEYYEGEGLMVSVMIVQEATTTVGRYGVSSDGNFALVSIIQ